MNLDWLNLLFEYSTFSLYLVFEFPLNEDMEKGLTLPTLICCSIFAIKSGKGIQIFLNYQLLPAGVMQNTLPLIHQLCINA
jgi:hypothetical protein